MPNTIPYESSYSHQLTRRCNSQNSSPPTNYFITPTLRLNMTDLTMETDIPDINLLKSTKILVYVEEALQDLLVVSYAFDSKFFQGILLDSTKRRIPTGVALPSAATKAATAKGVADEDLLCKAIQQRFTYFQEVAFNGGKWTSKRTKNGKTKGARMNVRLRPRQVLCSKCRSICTENSDSVDHSTKASGDQPGSKLAVAVENSRRSLRLSATIEKSPRPLLYESFKNRQMKTRACQPTPAMLTPSLVPKLSRLQPNEISSALNGTYSPKLSLLNGGCCPKAAVASPKSDATDGKYPRAATDDEELKVTLPETGSIPQKGALDMQMARSPSPAASTGAATSFALSGSQVAAEEDGKMVLRKKHSIGSMEDLWDESIFEDQLQKTKTTPVLKISFGSEGQGTVLKIPAKVTNNSSASECGDEEGEAETRTMDKAARKAHKKAKKEAKKRMIAIASPARSPAYENFFGHRSRHKIKRKRRHKYPRATAVAQLPALVEATERCADSDAERSKSEKLSISFKRLEGNAYTATRNESNESPEASPNGVADEAAGAEAQPEAGAEAYAYRTRNGRTIEVDDVVWAMAKGSNWWPGKVLSFESSKDEQSTMYANISWFGSMAPSLISCDNMCTFSENYKSRFNKQCKSGQYKEAVKTATLEAKKKRGIPVRSSRASGGSLGSANGGGGLRSF